MGDGWSKRPWDWDLYFRLQFLDIHQRPLDRSLHDATMTLSITTITGDKPTCGGDPVGGTRMLLATRLCRIGCERERWHSI